MFFFDFIPRPPRYEFPASFHPGSTFSENLETVLHWLLAKDPNDRLSSRNLVRILWEWDAGSSASSSAPSSEETGPKPTSANDGLVRKLSAGGSGLPGVTQTPTTAISTAKDDPNTLVVKPPLSVLDQKREKRNKCRITAKQVDAAVFNPNLILSYTADGRKADAAGAKSKIAMDCVSSETWSEPFKTKDAAGGSSSGVGGTAGAAPGGTGGGPEDSPAVSTNLLDGDSPLLGPTEAQASMTRGGSSSSWTADFAAFESPKGFQKSASFERGGEGFGGVSLQHASQQHNFEDMFGSGQDAGSASSSGTSSSVLRSAGATNQGDLDLLDGSAPTTGTDRRPLPSGGAVSSQDPLLLQPGPKSFPSTKTAPPGQGGVFSPQFPPPGSATTPVPAPQPRSNLAVLHQINFSSNSPVDAAVQRGGGLGPSSGVEEDTLFADLGFGTASSGSSSGGSFVAKEKSPQSSSADERAASHPPAGASFQSGGANAAGAAATSHGPQRGGARGTAAYHDDPAAGAGSGATSLPAGAQKRDPFQVDFWTSAAVVSDSNSRAAKREDAFDDFSGILGDHAAAPKVETSAAPRGAPKGGVETTSSAPAPMTGVGTPAGGAGVTTATSTYSGLSTAGARKPTLDPWRVDFSEGVDRPKSPKDVAFDDLGF